MDTIKNNEKSHLINIETHNEKGAHLNPSKGRKLFVLVACMMQQLICNGIGYGLSVMYAELIIVFESKRSETALVQSIYMAIATGAGILFTGAITKLGPGISMSIGGTVAFLGLFLSSFSTELTTIILCTGVVASLGMCVCYLASSIAICRMFSEDAGIYLVALTLGSSIGQFVVPILYETFIDDYSWSGAFMLISGVALQIVPFGVGVHFSKRYYKTQVGSKNSTMSALCECSVLKDWLIWFVYINYLLLALTGNFEAWFLVDLAISRGFSRESGSIFVTALGFSNVVGRLLGVFISFRCSNLPTLNNWIYFSPFLVAGHILFVNVNDFWGLFTLCILFGVPFGAMLSLRGAIMLELTSISKYPQSMAIANLLFGIAYIVGGELGGFIKDYLGNYNLAFYIAAGLSVYICVTTAIISMIMRRRNNHQNYRYSNPEIFYNSLKE